MPLPLATHLFLVAVPLVIGAAAVVAYLAGGRRER